MQLTIKQALSNQNWGSLLGFAGLTVLSLLIQHYFIEKEWQYWILMYIGVLIGVLIVVLG